MPVPVSVTVSTALVSTDPASIVTRPPADELPRIFDRFWRGRQAAQLSGSGIGLAVAAELVRAHDGQLTARSQPGEGTELTLTLPRV